MEYKRSAISQSWAGGDGARVVRRIRHRLILVHAALVTVIALGAVAALVALRATGAQIEQRQMIDARLAQIEQLRADTRELARSARRYVLSGDTKEWQRVLAIADDIGLARDRLRARSFSPHGRTLEASLESYPADVILAMGTEHADPVERLAQFEDALARVRMPLGLAFDALVSRERVRREPSASVLAMARSAQWGVILGAALGAALAIASVVIMLRRVDREAYRVRGDGSAGGSGSFARQTLGSRSDAPSEPTMLG